MLTQGEREECRRLPPAPEKNGKKFEDFSEDIFDIKLLKRCLPIYEDS